MLGEWLETSECLFFFGHFCSLLHYIYVISKRTKFSLHSGLFLCNCSCLLSWSYAFAHSFVSSQRNIQCISNRFSRKPLYVLLNWQVCMLFNIVVVGTFIFAQQHVSNHRIFWAGDDPWGPLSPAPVSTQGNLKAEPYIKDSCLKTS